MKPTSFSRAMAGVGGQLREQGREPEFVAAGGVMSYSSNRAGAGRRIGNYTRRILEGAKPRRFAAVFSRPNSIS
jgi:hypothetical protein